MNTKSTVFPVTEIMLAGTSEDVVVGGRDKFPLLSSAFAGVSQIGVIGWGSQGPAQAQNLRESLLCTNIRVCVGLQKDSSSFEKAEKCGFVHGDTLGNMYKIISKSDLVIVLISDAAQAENFEQILGAMKPGATLGLSHGFLLGHMKNIGAKFRDDINVVAVCPKGMGPSVRRLYEQGREVNGAGINSSYAVHQDVTGTARNIALGWAVAIGSPYIFETTLEMEYRSDIFGERAILLGAVWGISEALYSHFSLEEEDSPRDAFIRSALCITGPISEAISRGGLLEVANVAVGLDFFKTVEATYLAALPICEAIYVEVSSGREISSVIDATNRLKKYPMSRVDGTPMWRMGALVRKEKYENIQVDATTAGVYVGIMLAQVDILRNHEHRWNEVCNETIIEAVDSLNPFMAARGVDGMIDGCSTTARLGARKWGPGFAQMVLGDVLPNVQNVLRSSDEIKDWFENHPIHSVLAETMKLRPSVNIAVQ